MFGIGYTEAFIIAVAALVVFGPERLPEVAGQVGRWIREFRKMTSDLTGEFEKTIAEVDDIRDTVRREMKSMMDEVDDVAEGVKRDLSTGSGKRGGPAKLASGPAAKDTANSGTKTATRTGAKATALSKPKAVVATKADPLVDVSALDDALLTGPVSTNGNGSKPSEEDALDRVRRRRAAAAYSRRG